MEPADNQASSALEWVLHERFQHDVPVPQDLPGAERLIALASRGSCRHFDGRPVPLDILRVICAVAMSSPTKSDLQQRDIVIISDPDLRDRLLALMSDQPWTAGVPSLLVVCGNNQRQRRLHELRGRLFANDHLDAFLNASVDAGIALAAVVAAADAVGLGSCPLSAIRNHPREVDRLLNLPEHSFPLAGLALGYPARPPMISQRLPLDVTVHIDRLDCDAFARALPDYDATREARQPYPSQRRADELGRDRHYGWSEDKARQYSAPERTDFGGYILSKGFRLR